MTRVRTWHTSRDQGGYSVHDLTFGFSLQPTTDIGAHRELAEAADALRLDPVGIQDHPYIADFVDTFTLAGVLLAATEHIAVFPDVANLPRNWSGRRVEAAQ